MTRTEHLLVILGEECAEVAQRAAKALRFGLNEVQPDQNESNAVRLVGEYADLAATLTMLQQDGVLPMIPSARLAEKHMKVEKYLLYSAKCGTLTEES